EAGVGKVLSKVPKYSNLTNLMQTAIKTGVTAVPYEAAVAIANERELSGREGALAAGSNFLLSALIGKATGGGRLFNPRQPQAQRTPVAGAPQPIHEEGVVGTGAMSNVDRELAGISVGAPPPPKVGAKDPIGDMHRQAQAEAKAAEAVAKAQYGPTPAAPQPLPQQKVKLVDFGTRTKQVDDAVRKSYVDKAQAIEQYWGTRQYTRTDEGFTIKGTEKTRNAYEQNVMAAAKKAAIAREAFENVSLNKEPHESAFALIDDMWRKITKTGDARAELETLGYKGFKEENLQQYNDAFQLAETLGIAPENITGKVLKEHFGWKQNVANDIARQIRDDINFENDLIEGQRIYEARIKEQTKAPVATSDVPPKVGDSVVYMGAQYKVIEQPTNTTLTLTNTTGTTKMKVFAKEVKTVVQEAPKEKPVTKADSVPTEEGSIGAVATKAPQQKATVSEEDLAKVLDVVRKHNKVSGTMIQNELGVGSKRAVTLKKAVTKYLEENEPDGWGRNPSGMLVKAKPKVEPVAEAPVLPVQEELEQAATKIIAETKPEAVKLDTPVEPQAVKVADVKPPKEKTQPTPKPAEKPIAEKPKEYGELTAIVEVNGETKLVTSKYHKNKKSYEQELKKNGMVVKSISTEKDIATQGLGDDTQSAVIPEHTKEDTTVPKEVDTKIADSVSLVEERASTLETVINNMQKDKKLWEFFVNKAQDKDKKLLEDITLFNKTIKKIVYGYKKNFPESAEDLSELGAFAKTIGQIRDKLAKYKAEYAALPVPKTVTLKDLVRQTHPFTKNFKLLREKYVSKNPNNDKLFAERSAKVYKEEVEPYLVFNEEGKVVSESIKDVWSKLPSITKEKFSVFELNKFVKEHVGDDGIYYTPPPTFAESIKDVVVFSDKWNKDRNMASSGSTTAGSHYAQHEGKEVLKLLHNVPQVEKGKYKLSEIAKVYGAHPQKNEFSFGNLVEAIKRTGISIVKDDITKVPKPKSPTVTVLDRYTVTKGKEITTKMLDEWKTLPEVVDKKVTMKQLMAGAKKRGATIPDETMMLYSGIHPDVVVKFAKLMRNKLTRPLMMDIDKIDGVLTSVSKANMRKLQRKAFIMGYRKKDDTPIVRSLAEELTIIDNIAAKVNYKRYELGIIHGSDMTKWPPEKVKLWDGYADVLAKQIARRERLRPLIIEELKDVAQSAYSKKVVKAIMSDKPDGVVEHFDSDGNVVAYLYPSMFKVDKHGNPEMHVLEPISKKASPEELDLLGKKAHTGHKLFTPPRDVFGDRITGMFNNANAMIKTYTTDYEEILLDIFKPILKSKMKAT
ncbi:MAG: hypothetical protein PHR07_09460, partial [Acidaminococcaceae bacterium]|nr:hypothetical protein [Acidaminococcaceae bacterium]